MELSHRRLDGRFVSLEPVRAAHKEEVRAALDCDPETWALMPYTALGDRFDGYWTDACSMPNALWYAARRRADGRVVGIAGFLLGLVRDGGVEIGGTFLHPDARGGGVNPEMKLLMLAHAFDSGAVRVQFRVDARNTRSQAAVAKLGAVREGVLRRDKITWTGYVRDTVVFSIMSEEWPTVRAALQR